MSSGEYQNDVHGEAWIDHQRSCWDIFFCRGQGNPDESVEEVINWSAADVLLSLMMLHGMDNSSLVASSKQALHGIFISIREQALDFADRVHLFQGFHHPVEA